MTNKPTVDGRKPASLEDWDHWVDTIIRNAQDRGDFDNLPGRGKPLKIEENPFARGMEVGFGMLKNAGVAPFWIELGKEIAKLETKLTETANEARAIAAEIATLEQADMQARGVTDDAASANRPGWRRMMARKPAQTPADRDARLQLDRARGELVSLERRYAEQAAKLNDLISQFNAALPRDVWYAERVKIEPALPRDLQTLRGDCI